MINTNEVSYSIFYTGKQNPLIVDVSQIIKGRSYKIAITDFTYNGNSDIRNVGQIYVKLGDKGVLYTLNSGKDNIEESPYFCVLSRAENSPFFSDSFKLTKIFSLSSNIFRPEFETTFLIEKNNSIEQVLFTHDYAIEFSVIIDGNN